MTTTERVCTSVEATRSHYSVDISEENSTLYCSRDTAVNSR